MDGKEEEWRKGPWTAEEDKLLSEYVKVHGEGRWTSVATGSGLNRTGKSCRLRWVNYLRPGLKRGHLTPQEKGIVIELHGLWGNKWSTIARYLPGRTDNEIKNYWRTHFKKMKPKRKATPKPKPDNKTMAATKDHELIMKPCERDSNDDHLGMAFTDHQPSAMAEDQSFLSMVYQDCATWAAPAVEEEDSLWGGLWEVPKNIMNNYWGDNVET